MPRKALTLFSCTTPRILPEVVLATGPCPAPSLAFAAIALFNAPPRILLAPSAAPPTKDRRFILVFIVLPKRLTCQPGTILHLSRAGLNIGVEGETVSLMAGVLEKKP